MFPSSEQPSVGIDNTAGRSGFFINTASSLPLPADTKVVAVPPKITVENANGELLFGCAVLRSCTCHD